MPISIAEKMKEALQVKGISGDTSITSGVVAGIESADEVTRSAYDTLANEVDTVLNMGLEDDTADVSYGAAQKEAATFGLALGLDPSKALSRSMHTSDGIDPVKLGVTDGLEAYAAGVEAFDGQRADDFAAYSFEFNLKVTKQAELIEAFFPIVVLDPSQAAMDVKVDVSSVMQGFLRTGIKTGAEKFKKVALIKAMNDINGPFSDESNAVVPVLRTSTPTQDASDKVLYKDLPSTVSIGGKDITTAPIQTGVKVDLLAISQTDDMLARGVMDQTETLDRAIKLRNVYVKMTGAGGDEVFKIDTSVYPFAQFLPTREGDNKDFSIAFETDSVGFDSNVTKQITATGEAASDIMGTDFGTNFKVKCRMVFTGTGNYQTGDIAGYGSAFELLGVEKAGVALPTTDADYVKVKAVIDTAAIVAYDADARVTNSNLHVDLPVITVDTVAQKYVVPIRPGFRVQRPVTNAYGTDNTASKVNGAISAAAVRMTIAGVKSINEYMAGMKAAVAHGYDLAEFDTTGIGRYLVNTAFYADTINMVDVVDSEKSSERDEDIEGALTAKIKRACVSLLGDSHYATALSAYKGNDGAKVTAIIGVSTEIAAYLPDEIELGFGKGKVYALPGKLFGSRIVVSFGGLTKAYSGEFHPLNSGVTGYRPEILIEATRTVSNSTTNDLVGNPSYIHAVNLPVWGEIAVTGLEAVTNKVTRNQHGV